MTDQEVKLGKLLKRKTQNIYEKHPEYLRFKTTMDKYEEFTYKMAEKYGCSAANINWQIDNLRS